MLAKKVQGAGGAGGVAAKYLVGAIGASYDDVVTIDVSDPASMSGVFSLGGFADPRLVNVDSANSFAMVTDIDNVSPLDYVKSVDISDPLNTSILDSLQPSIVNQYADTDTVNQVYYSAQASNSFVSVDCSNPSNLTELYGATGVTSPYNGQNVRADPVNDIVIVISGGGSPSNGAFFVIDVSNPSSPSLVGSLIVSGQNFRGVALDTANKIAYVSSGATARLYKISYATPSSPSVLASVLDGTYLNNAHQMKFNASQGVLYVCGSQQFSSYSTSLVRLDGFQLFTSSGGIDIDETEEIAYPSYSSYLAAVDISDPSNVSLISTFSSAGYAPTLLSPSLI